MMSRRCQEKNFESFRAQAASMRDGEGLQKVVLNIEELEQRIAPDSINGVPGERNGNSGNDINPRAESAQDRTVGDASS
jgi:hypothetical protein